MKVITNRIPDDLKIDESIEAIATVLNGQIESDNLKYESISGTTHATGGTAKLFVHKLKAVPKFWLPSIGAVYVKEFTSEAVDIRSTANSTTFTILLVR